jgi:hypothetical protein
LVAEPMYFCAGFKWNEPMETAENPEERQVVCSACVQMLPESLIHVIPGFNTNAGGYVTTYRCESCWLPSLLETEMRLASTETATEIALAATFLNGMAY